MTSYAIARHAPWFRAATDAAADWLSLAAMPAFALMAAFAAAGPHDPLCAIGARPMNGMVWMYALTAIRHAGPWLKLVSGVSTSR